MNYSVVKQLHVTCVILSISLFFLRGSLTLMARPWRSRRLLRTAPHLIDSVLLGSALWMVAQSGQYPFEAHWLTAKVLALLAYIGFGMRALGENTPQAQRLPFFVAALLSVAYIVGVALSRSPTWGLLG